METYVPSNTEINQAMETAEMTLEETKRDEKRNLNRTGKEIIDQAEKLIFDARRLVNEKNRNDLVQKIIHEGSEAYNDLQQNRERWTELQRALNEFDSDAIKKKMDNLMRTAKLVAIELISSASFRQTVYDFFSLLYSVLVDATQLDKIGKPLKEAIEGFTEGTSTTEGATEKLKEAGERAVNFTLDVMDTDKPIVKLTDEQKDALIERLREILRNFAKRERTQRIIHGLFDIMDLISRPVWELTNQASLTAEEIKEDEHLKKMLNLTQQLFEAFTRRSLGPLLSHFKVLYRSITEDPELKQFFRELRDFFLNVIEHPELIGTYEVRDQIDNFIERARAYADQKKGLRHNFAVMREEMNKIIYSLERDPLTIALQEDIKNLVEMVLLDKSGRVTFKPEVLEQLKIIALSALVKRLRFPLPPLTFDDGQNLRFTVTGLILGIQDLLPERIIAENHGIAIVDMKELEVGPTVSKAAEAVKIKMENIHVHMPEADIWFHRRSFPEIQDSGKAKIDIGGDGMDLIFLLKAVKGSDRLFVLDKVECVIHSLSLTLEQTHHDLMYNALITIFKGFIKRNIEDAIQESMANIFEQLTDQIEKQVTFLRTKLPELTGKQ